MVPIITTAMATTTEHPAHAVELLLQRSPLRRSPLEHPGNAAHLRVHAGGHHHGPAAPAGDGRPAEDHVVPVPEDGVSGDLQRVLGHGQALAGEGALRGLQGGGADEPGVGGNGVALLDDDDVARHHLGRGHRPPLAVAHHVGLGGRHLAKRRHRRFRAGFLDEAQDRVEQHDGENGQGLVRQRGVALDEPEGRGDRSGHEEQEDQHVLELGEEAPPHRRLRLRLELVAAVEGQPLPGLRGAQAGPAVDPERREHGFDGLAVGR
jgi:hypothetical protein